MPVIQLEESNYAGIIPEDTVLHAKVTAIGQKKMKWQNDDGSDVFKMEFSFVIEDAESVYDGQRLWGNTSVKFNTHPECRLRNWANELLATDLEPGFQLDTDDLVGAKCRVAVGIRSYEQDGEKKERNFVKDVLRLRNGTPFAAATPTYNEEPF